VAAERGPDRLCGAAMAVENVEVAVSIWNLPPGVTTNDEHINPPAVQHVHRFDADGVCACGASACGRCDGRGWVPPYGVSLPAGFDPSEHGERCPSCDGEGA